MVDGPQPLGIESWMSINGRTWIVCEHFCILSWHKSLEEAEASLERIKQEREATLLEERRLLEELQKERADSEK
jgi:hypothetical protein